MTTDCPIRILVVDDHPLVRDSLASRIAIEVGLEVVATAKDGDGALQAALEHHPDIVLMDVDMPGLSAFVAAARISEELPDARVVFVSAFCHDAYVDQAIRAKAWGYLGKDQPVSALCEAIREVARGWVQFAPGIRDRIVSGPDGPRLAASQPSRVSLLSPREIEVLRYLAQGLSTRQIAETMEISTKTVENHKTHLMSKLGIHDRVELARLAYREGLVRP